VGGEGRDVTHAMMAAGHPPLVFSLAKFLHDMPPHWKEGAPRDLAAWEAGTRAAAAARLRQVARMADAGKDWPEFAAFDCYACHQAIGSGGASGAERSRGRPGDLPLDVAPLEVLAAGDAALAKRLEATLSATYRPGAARRPLVEMTEHAADEVDRLPAASEAGFRQGLDTWLARVEAGEVRAHYATMQQAALATFALAVDPEAPAFAEAYGALDEALSRPYDARACAALARRALAAR
jgi:hypothetical protein